MAKLYAHMGTMNAGKSIDLLRAAHNYQEQGMNILLLTAALDDRFGVGMISSRIGISEEAAVFNQDTDLFALIWEEDQKAKLACVFLDESQFLTEEQVWQLSNVVDCLGIPVMCYGLRVDFQGKLFPGSAALLAWADVRREIRTLCHCGKLATMVLRFDEVGEVVKEGPQVEIGGNDTYKAVCRRHWKEAWDRL